MVGRKSFLFFFLGWVFLPCLPPICLLHYVYLTLGGNRELDSSCPTFLCLYFQEIDWWRQTTSSTLIIFIHPISFWQNLFWCVVSSLTFLCLYLQEKVSKKKFFGQIKSNIDSYHRSDRTYSNASSLFVSKLSTSTDEQKERLS
jgi:hypothetical protein